MRHLCLLSWVILLMNGCTTLVMGNFNDTPAAISQQLARDSAKELYRYYPPAYTQWLFINSQDRYGTALTQALRIAGYSILEISSARQALVPPRAIAIHYVIDKVTNSNVLRVSLALNDQWLSRAYTVNNGQIVASGPWSLGGAS